jgi:hypothetical protein
MRRVYGFVVDRGEGWCRRRVPNDREGYHSQAASQRRRGHCFEADRQRLPGRPVPRLDQGLQSCLHRRSAGAERDGEPMSPGRLRADTKNTAAAAGVLAVQREGCGRVHKEKGPAKAACPRPVRKTDKCET